MSSGDSTNKNLPSKSVSRRTIDLVYDAFINSEDYKKLDGTFDGKAMIRGAIKFVLEHKRGERWGLT